MPDFQKADSHQMIERSFYMRDDVVLISRELIGKYLFTCFEGKLTGGIISETEAYNGIVDKASHAWSGRRTARTEIMYRKGGTAYIYLCYGIHSLFNIVTNNEDIPHAVLIRSIIPVVGFDLMCLRTNKRTLNHNEGIGPGKVSKLLGIHYSNSGLDISYDQLDRKSDIQHDIKRKIWIEDRGIIPEAEEVHVTKRIGVDYAQEDADLPYRFVWHKKTP